MIKCTWCGRLMNAEYFFYVGSHINFCKPSHMMDYDSENIFIKLWLWFKHG